MKKPVIVITPQNMPMEAPFGGNYNYSNTFNSDAVISAGGIPVIPPFLGEGDALDLMERADGLLMSGGADVSPELYGEEKLDACGTTEPLRDRSDRALLKAALRLHKPILCICRGFQMANVYFGGTLYQDLPTQFDGAVRHSAYGRYDEPVHPVRIGEETPLGALFGRDALTVNSVHHQAVRQLAPCLRPMAWAEDGIVESWYLPDQEQWLRGYQWHPEMLKDPQQRELIFGEFIAACGR